MIRKPHEKKGGAYVSRSMKLFNDFINGNELFDRLLLGRRFMWTNRDQVAMSRIDRFLLSKEWDEHYVGVI